MTTLPPDPPTLTADGSATALHCVVLRSWEEVLALECEWNALLARSRADAIFLTHEWIRAWLSVRRDKCVPYVITVRDGNGTLRGAAGFYVASYRLLRALAVRVLRVLGDWPTGADYPDWLADADVEHAVCAAIGRTLQERRREWDLVWMPNVAGWTGARQRFDAAARAGNLRCATREATFAWIPLPDTLAAYEGSFSADRRQQLRRKRRQMMNRETVATRRCETADELPEVLEELFRLHGMRWRSVGEDGSFARKPDEAEFYRRFAPVALAKGWLELHTLSDGGVAKAIQYGYRYRDTFLQVQEGFDPEYTAGVGNVLRHNVIDACIASGIREYDFLGGMSEHKSRWQAQQRNGCDVLIGHGGLLSAALVSVPVWPTGRYLQRRPE